MIEKIQLFLSGKKTYLVALGAIIAAILAFANGQMDIVALAKAIIEAILAMTIRAGVAKIQ